MGSKLLRGVGWLVLSCGAILFFLGQNKEFQDFLSRSGWSLWSIHGLAIVVGGVGGAIVGVGGSVVETSYRAEVVPAETKLKEDRRPPIVYLRSIYFDNQPTPGSVRVPFMPRRTIEQDLVDALCGVGPVIAIGDGEVVGAARLSITEGQDWQSAVTEIIRVAALVVVRVGTTSGLRWEFETAVKEVDPRKILLFFPDTVKEKGAAAYQEFLELARGVAPSLPSDPPESQFLWFQSDWRYVFLPRVPVGKLILRSEANRIRRELAPVREALWRMK